MSDLAVGTVVSRNHMAYARVLADSLRRWHPELELYVLVIDHHEGDEPFELLTLEGVSRSWRFAHSLQEVLVLAKPILLGELLRRGHERALLLDSDMLVTAPLDPLLDAVRDAPVVLTPHLLEPVAVDRELQILLSGVFNGGVIGVGGDARGRAFLEQWSERLDTYCRSAVERGLYYEQRWLDLAPSTCTGLRILRDPTINVAWWNLPERDPGQSRLLHFSRQGPALPDELVAPYWAMLEEQGVREGERLGYEFARFADGAPIPDAARTLYREAPPLFRDPFTDPGFRRWLDEPLAPEVSRLWDAVYRSRPDLQEAWPDHLGEDREWFAAWIREYGPTGA